MPVTAPIIVVLPLYPPTAAAGFAAKLSWLLARVLIDCPDSGGASFREAIAHNAKAIAHNQPFQGYSSQHRVISTPGRTTP